MNILLVYPECPDTFWSFKHILRILSRKAAFPPLGLLTVAAMLPSEWDKELVDMNIDPLTDEQLEWADYVFISAMIIQRDSARRVIARCKQHNVKTVAGGPLFNTYARDFEEVDHLILNEAEMTLPPFLEDLKNGCPKAVYTSKKRPDIGKAPVPLWDLIKMKRYVSMPVQYSRGCPHNCDFCDIIIMNGRVPRTKDTEQFLGELEALYQRKWRGPVFVVDDNFVGNKRRLRQMLPELTKWMRKRNYPFSLCTEASLDLADEDELLRMMVDAGFSQVFCGIETPVQESLVECSKHQNARRDLRESVKRIQNAGMQVMGGFILGFDTDPSNVFERQLRFIQQTGIVTAMIGLLQALPGTRLHERLARERRLLETPTGDNVDCTLNFIPKMDCDKLLEGYRKLLQLVYSPANMYKRIATFLNEYRPPQRKRVYFFDVLCFVKSIWYLGIRGKSRRRYWHLVVRSLFRHPRSFAAAMGLAIVGHHFQMMVQNITGPPAVAGASLP